MDFLWPVTSIFQVGSGEHLDGEQVPEEAPHTKTRSKASMNDAHFSKQPKFVKSERSLTRTRTAPAHLDLRGNLSQSSVDAFPRWTPPWNDSELLSAVEDLARNTKLRQAQPLQQEYRRARRQKQYPSQRGMHGSAPNLTTNSLVDDNRSAFFATKAYSDRQLDLDEAWEVPSSTRRKDSVAASTNASPTITSSFRPDVKEFDPWQVTEEELAAPTTQLFPVLSWVGSWQESAAATWIAKAMGSSVEETTPASGECAASSLPKQSSTMADTKNATMKMDSPDKSLTAGVPYPTQKDRPRYRMQLICHRQPPPKATYATKPWRKPQHILLFGHGRTWTLLALVLAWAGCCLAVWSRRSTSFCRLSKPLEVSPLYDTLDYVGLFRLELCYNVTVIDMMDDDGTMALPMLRSARNRGSAQPEPATYCEVRYLGRDVVEDKVLEVSRMFATMAPALGTFLTIVLSSALFWETINLKPLGMGFLLVYLFQSLALLMFDSDVCSSHKCRPGTGCIMTIFASICWIGACMSTAKMDAHKIRARRQRRRAMKKQAKEAAALAAAEKSKKELVGRESLTAATEGASDNGSDASSGQALPLDAEHIILDLEQGCRG